MKFEIKMALLAVLVVSLFLATAVADKLSKLLVGFCLFLRRHGCDGLWPTLQKETLLIN